MFTANNKNRLWSLSHPFLWCHDSGPSLPLCPLLYPFFGALVPSLSSWALYFLFIFPRLFSSLYTHFEGFPGGSVLKNLPAMQEIQVQSPGWEDPLEEKIAIHFSLLAWEIPWTEEPDRLHTVHGIARESDSVTKQQHKLWSFSYHEKYSPDQLLLTVFSPATLNFQALRAWFPWPLRPTL